MGLSSVWVTLPDEGGQRTPETSLFDVTSTNKSLNLDSSVCSQPILEYLLFLLLFLSATWRNTRAAVVGDTMQLLSGTDQGAGPSGHLQLSVQPTGQ